MKTYWRVVVSGPLHVFTHLPLVSIVQEAWWASTRLGALEKTVICHYCLFTLPAALLCTVGLEFVHMIQYVTSHFGSDLGSVYL